MLVEPSGSAAGAQGYQAHALPGSPARRLQQEAARLLGAGTVRRCPHPDEPAFWRLDTGSVACLRCATGGRPSAEPAAGCQCCGRPAAALAAWVAGDVACLAPLCDECSTAGLTPVTPN